MVEADGCWQRRGVAGPGGQLFKGAVTKEQWTQALAGVRLPLGKVISRKVTSRQYSEKVPGVPMGST